MYTYAEDEELHVITSMRLDVARYAPDRGAWSQAVDDKVGSLGAGTRPDRATVGRRRICYAEELRQCWLGFGDKTKLPARVVNIPPNTPLRVRWPNATMEDAQQWIAMIRPDTLKQYTFSYVFYRGFAEELNLDPDIEGVTQWHFEGKPPGG